MLDFGQYQVLNFTKQITCDISITYLEGAYNVASNSFFYCALSLSCVISFKQIQADLGSDSGNVEAGKASIKQIHEAQCDAASSG